MSTPSTGSSTQASPSSARDIGEQEKEALTFAEVLEHELTAVEKGRMQVRGIDAARVHEHESRPSGSYADDSAAQVKAHIDHAHRARLAGLAFSGGGIRSAVFNLGVLQSLAQHGLLRHFDYLSSVSGGGYIASWLHAWVHRESQGTNGDGIIAVEDKLSGASGQSEPAEVTWLRKYSNYLTPRTGLLGADTLAAVMSALRNLTLNAIMLLAMLLAALVIPWAYVHGLSFLMPWDAIPKVVRPHIAGVAGSFGALGTVALALGLGIGAKESALEPEGSGARNDGQARLRRARSSAGWLTAGAVLVGTAVTIAAAQPSAQLRLLLHATALILGAGYFTGFLLGWHEANFDRDGLKTHRRSQRTASAVLAAVAFGSLIWVIGESLGDITPPRAVTTAYVLYAPLLAPASIIAALVVSLTLHTGLAGRAFPEMTREWWSRTSGLAASWTLLASALCGVSLLGPYVCERIDAAYLRAGGFAWLVTWATGLFGASRERTGKRWSYVIHAAPYVFVVGLLLGASWGLYRAADWALPPHAARPPADAQGDDTGYEIKVSVPTLQMKAELKREVPDGAYLEVFAVRAVELAGQDHTAHILGALAGLGVVILLLGFAVDINVFSLHMFYRNRLERCFLGAAAGDSGKGRWVDLRSQDAPRLDALTLNPQSAHGQRPYPLINAAINLTRANNLAWQERKASSFVFTPSYCGYEIDAETARFQPTRRYVSQIGGYLSLSTPMTISGAAVSPTCGSFTVGAVAALMTVFNLRLGWWFQNTRKAVTWERPGPYFAPKYLLKEFLGNTNEDGNFIHLSDAGHFDNLGLYELVRRRCRYIVVSDAGADPSMTFGDLGNIIRKCRADFGVDIEIDPRPLMADPQTGLSAVHCVMGTIHYERSDKAEGGAPGYLLYVKSSMTGNEPADLLAHRSAHARFPHDPTGDQWFNESQFESYRALGKHLMDEVLKTPRFDERAGRTRRAEWMAKSVAQALDQAKSATHGNTGQAAVTTPLAADDAMCDWETLFERLEERWKPPCRVSGSVDRLEGAWIERQEQLRRDPNLEFLDAQLCPEWRDIQESRGGQRDYATMLPEQDEELRAGFYFCSSLIDLMEEVYSDLHLEETYDHPDHRGFMNLFRHWAGSGMFCATWSVTVGTHGARFQKFCERHLKLKLGMVVIGAWRRVADVRERAGHPWAFPNFVEREQLERLADSKTKGVASAVWDALHVAPVLLLVDDAQRGKPAFELPVGMAVLTRGDEGLKLHYFRVRDHLRKMGVGRQALEALWRDDCRLKVPQPGELDRGLYETDGQAIERLWANVKAAMPHRWIEEGERHLEDFDKEHQHSFDRAVRCLARATEAYECALQQQRDNEEAIRGLARVLRRRWELARRSNAARAEVAGESSIRELQDEARGNLQCAIALLQDAANSNPYASLVHYNLGCYYWLAREEDPAGARHNALRALGHAFYVCGALRRKALHDKDLDGLRDDVEGVIDVRMPRAEAG